VNPEAKTLASEASAVAAGNTNLPPMPAPVVQLPTARGAELPTARGAGNPSRWSDVAQAWRGRLAQLQGGRLLIGVGALALLMAALSLLLPSTPSYDPWAWLIWGREIVHLNLHTAGGPSWKPLPVIFTTVFALFGGAQPYLWLLVARAGALMAVYMAFRLSSHLTRALVSEVSASGQGATRSGQGATRSGQGAAGRLAPALPSLVAGVIAGGSLLLSWGFITENALGYSEGLAAALVLIAVERLMDGAPRQSVVIGFLAVLDRPELCFAWVPFGIYLYLRHPEWRGLVLGLFALIPTLWLLPELWGSGHLLRGVIRAQHPRADSAAFTSCPLCTVLQKEAWPSLLNRVKVPALLALVAGTVALVARARHGASPGGWSRGWLVAIGAFGWIWWLGVAVETQAGFSGNNRYLELGTAAVAVSGGVAWGWLAGWLGHVPVRLRGGAGPNRRPSLPAGALLATCLFLVIPPWIGTYIAGVGSMGNELAYQARLRRNLVAAVQQAGGARALLRCGGVMTEPFQVPMVAWVLGVRTSRIEPPPNRLARAPGPSVILQTRAHPTSALLPAPGQIAAWERAGVRYLRLARVGAFTVLRSASC
jgi:hypothetical protein